VKKKAKLLGLFPWPSPSTAQAFYPNIFVSSEVFWDLHQPHPNPRFIAVLEHEKKHIERQKELGVFKFGLKYLFFPRFRFQEELLAIKEGMKYLKRKNLAFDTDRSAMFLSSWLYLWMVTYARAKKELDKAWESIG